MQEGFINHVGLVTLIRLGRKSERTALPMVKHIDEWGFPKERFFNNPAVGGFSRAWTLRNGIAASIRLAIPLCKADRHTSTTNDQDTTVQKRCCNRLGEIAWPKLPYAMDPAN